MFNGLSRVDRVELLKANYYRSTGRAFKHFVCPILLVDELVELMDGHIIPANQGICNEWVPQREDVDSFYGSVAEADFKIAADIIDGSLSFSDLLINRPSRAPKPQLQVAGKNVDYYFPKSGAEPVLGHTVGKLHVGADQRDIAFKISDTELFSQDEREFKVVIDHDALPEVTATVLKAAYLTLFAIEGYHCTMTAAGQLLSHILREPIVSGRGKRPGQLRVDVRKHFSKYSNMIRPVIRHDSAPFRGSVIDRRFFACLGASGRVFAVGVLVPMKSDFFCVFLPTDQDPQLTTYTGFLNHPPPSVSTTLMEAVRTTDSDPFDFEWHVSPKPTRIHLKPTVG